ncbi:hypothetical protein PNEG_00537 [Pneumocystis murina B123]|uniref:Ubiquitin-like domain-containing protein n=1 Tax=Pneumocystis murina (strain B123) TaxID=1069680 RepID=M7NWJ6_PNEMU|nr:hypothetical protein PNEG_00537 [Pneumocystis murina B123]EMR11526.1 hypothetical protein PNEG_00537 [Pneumocystis murina B123]
MTISCDTDPSITKIHIIVRFSNGKDDIRLSMEEETTIRQLKERLRELEPEMLRKRSLRIIYLGKILKNEWVLSEVLNKQWVDHSEVIFHCSIGNEIESYEDEEREVNLPWSEYGDVSYGSSITPLPLGFDRLREVGFSEREIGLLREQFMMIHGRDSQDEQTEPAWQLEEDWINQTTSENITQEGYGAYEDMILGASIGFIGGIITLFFVWEPKIFYRRRQMAIVAGIMINLFFGFLRL